MSPDASDSPQVVKAFKVSLNESDHFTQLSKLVAVIQRASQTGVFIPLPSGEEEANKQVDNAYIAARLRTVRTRLTLLGYIPKDQEDSTSTRPITISKGRKITYTIHIDDLAREAIKRFQTDAGLTVDGWVGVETWTALEELVSFEQPSNMGRWVNNPKAQAALLRAVGLRLAVLGLSGKLDYKNKTIDRSLENFVALANRLSLTPQTLRLVDRLRTLTALFDQDELVRRLASVKGQVLVKFSADLPEEDGLNDKQAQNLADRFTACLARIELWLRGYQVDLKENYTLKDGKQAFESPSQLEGNIDVPAYQGFFTLYYYWRAGGLTPYKARQKAMQGAGGELFAQFSQAGAQEFDQVETDEASVLVYEQLEQASSYAPAKVWQQIEKLSSRLWDGLKRAYSWLKRMVDKVGDKLKSWWGSMTGAIKEKVLPWVLNLARLSYRFAARVFFPIREAVKGLLASVPYVIPGFKPDSDQQSHFIHSTPRLDLTIAAIPGQEHQVLLIAQEMNLQSENFHHGMRLVSVLLKIFLTLIKLPVAGWMYLIFGLLKAYRAIRSALKSENIGQAASA